MRSILFLSLLVASCFSEPITLPELDPQPTHDLVSLPVNRTFLSEAGVWGWRNDVYTAATRLADARQHDPDAFQLLSGFDLSPNALVAFAQAGTSVWSSEPRVVPEVLISTNPGEAKAAFDADDEYEAGLIYANIGDVAAVKRCITALQEEGETVAVAELAILINERSALFIAVDALVKARFTTHLENLADSAYASGKNNLATEIVKQGDLTDWIPSRDAIHRAAKSGHGEFLPDILARGYIEDVYGEILSNIVLIARSNRPAALQYARLYLERPESNPFFTMSTGEGDYFHPVADSVRFYELIKGDPALVKLYEDRVSAVIRRAVNEEVDGTSIDGSPSYDSMFGWSMGMWGSEKFMKENFLWSHLVLVKATGNTSLIRFWNTQLDVIGQRFPFDREVGRLVLLGTWNPSARDLTPLEQYALKRTAGKVLSNTPPPRDTETPGDRRDHSLEWLIRYTIELGRVSPAELSRVASLLGVDLAYGDQGTRDEIVKAVKKRMLEGGDTNIAEAIEKLRSLLAQPSAAMQENGAAYGFCLQHGGPCEEGFYPKNDSEAAAILEGVRDDLSRNGMTPEEFLNAH